MFCQFCSSSKHTTICSTDVQSCSVEIDNSGDQNDPSLKSYDPVTNFLSPRPTFLGYKPNRQYQLVLQLKNEAGLRKCERDVQKGLSFDAKKPTREEAGGEGNYGYSVSCSEDSQGSSVSCSDEGSVEEYEVIDDFEIAGEKNNGVNVPKYLSFDTKKPGFEEVLGADTQGSSVSCIEKVFVNDDDDEQIGKEDAEDYEINEVVDVPKDLSFDTKKPGFEEVLGADTQGGS